MIGIIGAMDIEVEGLIPLIDITKKEIVSGITFYIGKNAVLAKSGIGKVFAGICAQTMILKYNVEAIINVGVAGSLDKSLKIGDIVLASDVVQHDMDTSCLGDPVGLISGINKIYFETSKKLNDKLSDDAIIIGRIASGDKFLNSSAAKQQIVDNFRAIACEMEGAAIGQVCYINNIPFAVLRSISDSANEGSVMDYFEFSKHAAARHTEIIKRFLD
jgi:adenosylhomocysteine nucleosidase